MDRNLASDTPKTLNKHPPLPPHQKLQLLHYTRATLFSIVPKSYEYQLTGDNIIKQQRRRTAFPAERSRSNKIHGGEGVEGARCVCVWRETVAGNSIKRIVDVCRGIIDLLTASVLPGHRENWRVNVAVIQLINHSYYTRCRVCVKRLPRVFARSTTNFGVVRHLPSLSLSLSLSSLPVSQIRQTSEATHRQQEAIRN